MVCFIEDILSLLILTSQINIRHSTFSKQFISESHIIQPNLYENLKQVQVDEKGYLFKKYSNCILCDIYSSKTCHVLTSNSIADFMFCKNER